MTESNIMLEVGVIMFVAFLGAALASRTKQSVVLGYILAGILIGPFMRIDILGFQYHGVIADSELITLISDLGIVLLMFFVGLEFSISKLRKVERPAIILSLVNIGVNLFTGILLGTALGWPLLDTVFLSAVIAMSCAAVAMKSIIELGRLNAPETDFLLGVMVVEDFISAVFLAAIGGLMVKTSADTSMTSFLVGAAIFVAFFAVLALVVIPRTVRYLVRMKNDEMFVIFALGVVCMAAAVAEVLGIPAMIGAFFIGMTFAETKITERMEEKMAPFRDAFVAVFFMAFGMMIDPSLFPAVIGIVAVAVVLVFVDDVLITAVVSYFMGYSSRQSMAVSTSLCARGAESVMYASVAKHSVATTKGAELYPLAGAFTFIMSALCPFLMRRSNHLADGLARRMPHFIKYSASLVARTLSKIIMPGSGFRVYRGSRLLLMTGVFYLGAILALIATSGRIHYIAFGVCILAAVLMWFVLQTVLTPVVRQTSYSNLGAESGNHSYISRYVASLVLVTLLTSACVAFIFTMFWPAVLVVLAAYVMWFILFMKIAHDRTSGGSRYLVRPRSTVGYGVTPPPRTETHDQPRFNHRQRWKGL
ncbi:MAG: cation:proton antiporter [Methanomassiliicoccus sp.]|nr:cation:proton antiporter [Methanomassiliicoccus sp.]